MESPSFDAVKTQSKINLSDENNVSNAINADSDLTETGSGSPIQQQPSTVTAATACS